MKEICDCHDCTDVQTHTIEVLEDAAILDLKPGTMKLCTFHANIFKHLKKIKTDEIKKFKKSGLPGQLANCFGEIKEVGFQEVVQ